MTDFGFIVGMVTIYQFLHHQAPGSLHGHCAGLSTDGGSEEGLRQDEEQCGQRLQCRVHSGS